MNEFIPLILADAFKKFVALSTAGKQKKETPTSINKRIDFAALPQLLTIEQVSEILGVHPNTLRNWDRTGKLRAVRIGTRQDRRYEKQSIQKLYQELNPVSSVPLTPAQPSAPGVVEKSYVLEPGFSWRWVQLYLMSRKFSLYVFSVLLVAFSFAVVQVSFFAYIYLARAEEAIQEQLVVQPTTATGWETSAQALTIDLLPAASLAEFADTNAAHFHTDPAAVEQDEPVIIEQEIEFEDSQVMIEEESAVPLDEAKPELIVSNFIAPDNLDADSVITTAGLRVSLAIDGTPNSEDVLLLEYSVDRGVSWQQLDSLVLAEDMSNAIHGGYFEYQLPTFAALAVVPDLQFRAHLSAGVDPVTTVVWVDGVELQLETQRPDPVVMDIAESVAFTTDTDMDLTADEQPVITVETEEKSDFDFIGVEPIVREVRTVTITTPDGQTLVAPVTSDVATTDHGSSASLAIDPSVLEEPGKYTVTVTVEQDGRTQQVSYDFTWGALALNTDQANYKLGETVAFSLGAVDDTGHIICTADMHLSIIDPMGTETVLSSSSGTIEVTEHCSIKDVYTGPDYTATYVPSVPGTYQVALTATVNGQTRMLQDSFSVTPEPAFTIKRDGPTRVFPNVPQPMHVQVYARDGFSGLVRDIASGDFELIPGAGGSLENFDTGTEIARSIVWQVDIPAGGTIDLTYEFKSPEKSPATFALGPARIGDWVEPRAWQLVIDPAYMYVLGNSASAPTGWTNDTTTFAGYYPRGAATTDTTPPTGGATSHSHTVSNQTISSPSTIVSDWGCSDTCLTASTEGHSHGINSLTVGSANNDPLHHTFYLWKSNATDPTTIPNNAYVFFDAAPTGSWTRFSAADSRLVRIAASNTTGGTADTHTHSLTWGSLTAASGSLDEDPGVVTYRSASTTHTHTAPTGSTSASYTLLPSYIQSLIYQATADNSVPQNLIAMWDAAPPTGWTTVSGASQTYNGQFIRGAASYSATPQSADTHSMANEVSGASGTPSANGVATSSGTGVARSTHTHTITASFNANTDHKPQYFDVIMAECTNASGCGAASGISIGGSLYSDEGSTKITSAAKTIVLWVNGNANACGGGACTAETSSGDWTIANVSAVSGDIITIFVDQETEEATTVFKSDGTAQTNAHLYQNRVIVRNDTGTSITNTNLESGDREGGDDDVKFDIASSNLTVDSNFELHIWTGDTYDPNGTVTTQGTGSLHVDDSATAYLDTATNTIAGSTTIDTGATLNVQNSTNANGDSGVTVTGTLAVSGGTFAIGDGLVEDLISTGTTTLSGGTINVADDLLVSNGTTTISTAVNVWGNTTGSTIGHSGGTMTFTTGAAVIFTGEYQITGGTTHWNAGTITGDTPASSHIRMNGTLTANLAGASVYAGNNAIVEMANSSSGTVTFNMSSGHLYARGFLIYNVGTLSTTAGGGTLHLGWGGGGDATTRTFYDIQAAAHSFYNLQIDEDSKFHDSTTQTLNLAGSFIISSGKTFNGNDNTMAVTGNFTNNGTAYTAGTSTVQLVGSGAINGSTNTTFYNLTIGDGSAGTVTVNGTDDPTITNTLNIDTGDELSIGSGLTVTHSNATNTTLNGTVSGAGRLVYPNGAGGPGTTGTLSAITRYDATSGDVASTTIDARTYTGPVEFYSNSAIARIVTPAAGTYTLSGAGAHLYVEAANTANITVAANTNNPTMTIGGNLEFTGAGAGTEIITSGTGTWTVTNVADLRDGTYTATSGNTFALDGADTDNFYPNGQTFYNFSLLTNFTVATMLSHSMTVTNTFSVVDLGQLTISSGLTVTLTSTGTLTDTASAVITGDGTYIHQAAILPGLPVITSNIRLDATTNSITLNGRTGTRNLGVSGRTTELYSNSASSRTITIGDVAGRAFTMQGALTSTAAAAGVLTIEVNTYDPTLTINQALTIGVTTVWQASSATATDLKGSYTNNGTFTDNLGTITLSGTAQQVLSGSMTTATNDFNNLTLSNTSGTYSGCSTSFTPAIDFAAAATVANNYTITTAGVEVEYNSGSTYTFTNINWAGGSGNEIIFRNSNLTSGTWLLNVSGTQTAVTYVNVGRSDATPGNVIIADDGTNIDCGGNTDWDFGFTISGTANGNNGATVRVAYNGTLQGATGSISSGTWTIAGATEPVTNDEIYIWVDNVADASESTAITVYDGAGHITGMVLNTHVVTIGSGDNPTFTDNNCTATSYQNLNDEDIMFSCLTTLDGPEFDADDDNLYADDRVTVLSGAHFDMSGSYRLITHDFELNGQYTPGDGVVINGSWDNNGDYNAASESVSFTSTTTETIDNTGASDSDIANMTLNGSGGQWTLNSTQTVNSNLTMTLGTLVVSNALTVTGNIAANAGTIQGTANITVGGDFTGDGTVTMTAGSVEVQNTSNIGGATAWTFNNLIAGYVGACSASYTMTATGSGQFTITGQLNYESCSCGMECVYATLVSLGSKTWRFTGSGTGTSQPLYATITGSGGTSTVIYEGTGTTDIYGGVLYNLRLDPASGTPTYNLNGGSFYGDLFIDPAVNFVHANGTAVNMVGNGKTVDAGGKTFYRLYINGDNNAVTVVNTDFTVTNFLYVETGATLTINSSRTVTTSTPAWLTDGTINGAGLLVLTNSVGMDSSGTIDVDVRFDAASGDIADTTFVARTYGGDVELYTNSGQARAFTVGSGTLSIGGNFSSNSPSGANLIDLTAPTSITITGAFTIPTGDGLQGWSSMSIGGNMTIDGSFSAGTAGITLNGTGLQTITGTLTGNNSFYDLTVTNASAGGVVFSNSTDVDGTFTAITANTNLGFVGGTTHTWVNININGQAVGTRVDLIRSSGAGSWNLIVTGTQSVSYANPSNSNACSGDRIRAYNGTNNDGGSNNCWVFTGVTVSGTLYSDQGSSLYNCSTNNITIWGATNGESGDSSVCTSAAGSFSVTVLPAATAGDPIILYIDTGESIQGNFVTLAADTSSNITGARIYAGWVVVRHENAGPMTNAKMLTADNGNAGILYADNSGVQFNSGINLHLWADDSYDPGGAVLLTSGGDVYLDDGSELWFDTGSTISGDITVANVLSNPAALHIDANTSMGGSLVVNGSIDGAGSLTVNGNFTGNGTVSFSGGTVTFPYQSNVGGNADWTFNNLAFTHGACGGKTSTANGSGSFTINGTFTGASCFQFEDWNHTFDPNDKTIIITASGTPMNIGLAGQTTNNSIIRYTNASVTIDDTFYNDLQLQPSSSGTHSLINSTYTYIYGDMTINSNVTLSAGTNTLVGLGTATTLDLNGETLYNLLIQTSGAGLTTVVNTDFSVSNSIDVDTGDTFSLSSGRTVTLTSAGSLTLDGTISGAGRLSYRPATAFPTTGTISSILRFDCTNNNTIMSDRVYGGDVEFFMPNGASRQVSIGTAGSQTPDITGDLTLLNADFDFLLTADASVYDPSVTIGGDLLNNGSGGLTTIGAGAGTWTVGGNVVLTNGQFVPDTGSTLIMNGTGTLFVDNILGSDTSPYNFQTSGSGTITLDDIMTVANDMVVGSGTTVTGAQNLTVTGGDMTGDGTLNLTAGTLTIPSTSGNFGGATGWTLNHFTLSSTVACADRTTTATGTGSVTINGVLTTAALYNPGGGCACSEESCYGHALNAGSKTWILTQSGTAGARPFINNGRLTGGTSVFRYTGTTATDIQSLSGSNNYYDLQIRPSGGTNPTYVFSSNASTISHDFTIGDGTNSITLNGASNNVALSIGNDLSCTAGASTNVITTGTGTWTVSGNTTLTNCDTFTATAGHTLAMSGASKAITSGGKSIANFQVSSGPVSSSDALDVNGTFTLLNNGTFTQHASSNMNVSSNVTLGTNTTFNKSTSGLFILDGDLTYTDNDTPKNDIGNVHIGTSPDTADLLTDMAASSITINDGDILNTNGYDMDIGTGGITIMQDVGLGGGTLDLNDDVETDGTYITTDGNFDLRTNATLANSAGTNVGSTIEFTLSGSASANATSDFITAGFGNPYDVVINDGNGTYYLTVEVEDALTITDDLTITSGVFDVKSGEDNAVSVGGDWTNADRFESRGGTVTLNASSVASGTVNIDSTGATTASFNDLTLNDSAGNDTFMLESTLDVNDDLLITGGTLDTKSGENNAITIGGDWTNNDIFTARSGVVTADGSAQQTFGGTLTGTSAFYDLTITNSTGSDPDTSPSVIFSAAGETDRNFTATTANTKLRFNAGSTYTFQNISFNGQASGTRVFLRSSSTSTQWNLNVAGTRSVSYTNVRDSNACGQPPDIDASNGTNLDATNNDCWNINSITFSISDTTIGFGSLSAIQDRYATGDGLGSNTEVAAHTISAATSGGGGYVISVQGSTLTSAASDTITYIGGTNTASSIGTEQFGLRATASGGSGTVSAPYAAAGFAYDLLNFPDEFASSAGASATTTYSLRYLGNISTTTEAGIYTTDITYIITPEF